MFGHTPQEAARLQVYDLIPHDPQGVDRNVERALEQGHVLVGERSYRRKDGSAVEVEVSGGVISYGGKEVICSIVRDITERKRDETALRESEERYRAVVEQSSEGIYLVDPETKRVLDANPAFGRLLGYGPDEIPRLTLYDFVAHDRKSVDENIRRILEEGTYSIGERQHRRKDGSIIDVEVGVNLISYGGREVLGCVAHDTTKRKRAEEALRESEERFRAVFESAGTGMALTDPDGRFLEANAAFEGILGYSEEELKGKTFAEVTYPDDVEPNLRLHRELVAGRLDRYHMEKRYVHKDGDLVWGELTISTIYPNLLT